MIRYSLLVSVACFGLGACTSSPTDELQTIPRITYENLTKIPVNVSRIHMISETQRGAQPWDIANDLPTPPDQALQRYLDKRYNANGRDGVLNVILKKADIRKDSVPNENRILSYIPLANNEDYTFEIVIELDSQYQSGQPNMVVTKRFVRQEKMPLNVTMSYREARLQRTLEEMVRDIDQAMISTLSDQFNLISDKNIPHRPLFLETKIPETATGVGTALTGVSKSLRGGTDDYRAQEKAREAKLEAARRNPDYNNTTATPVLVEPLPAE